MSVELIRLKVEPEKCFFSHRIKKNTTTTASSLTTQSAEMSSPPLIQITCQEQLDHVRATRANMVLFLDNAHDQLCQQLRAPLLSRCKDAGYLLVAVPSPEPVDACGRSGLPYVTVVVEAELVASFYDATIDALWSNIVACFKS